MSSAAETSVTLTPEAIRLVQAAVDAGEFASTSEAVGDAVRVWQRQRREHVERLISIKERIRRSLDDPRTSLTQAEVEAELDRLMQERAQSSRDAARYGHIAT
jgi:antitoxin ParD1/3/4